MAQKELVALLGDSTVGRVLRDGQGRISFVYDSTWSEAPLAYPISLSMPLSASEHHHRAIDAYLWGLLPDNELILQRWALRFHVSAGNAFALMTHVGEDCPGAIRFATPDRVRSVTSQARGKVDWLDEHDVAERLRALKVDASAWRQNTDAGQFSLAGAQPKTALLYDRGRWGVPSGRTPTTHILKPGTPELDGHAENEHFCLVLARELGFPTASSRVERFEDQIAIVVERYDRLATSEGFVRVHQEDTCQALAIHPARKYENEGGPGASEIVELLREHSRAAQEDITFFIESLMLNWLIGGTDAHAKNYSFLIGAEGRIRLAPLYDVASILPYAGKQFPKSKLAMKIGGKYRLVEIGAHQWDKLAREISLDGDAMRASLVRVTRALPDLAGDVLKRETQNGLHHPMATKLTKMIVERARQCAAAFP